MQAEDGVELAGLGLRQEADLAEVDAEERDVDVGDGPRRAQERAVATEDDEGVGRRQLADERRRVARRDLPLADAADLAPAGGARAQLDGGLDRRVVGEADAADGHVPVTSAMRSPISAQPGPGARSTRNSRLPSGSGDRRGDDRARAEAVRLRRPRTIRSRTSRWIAGSRTTPWSVRPLPASNWGLTRATMWRPGPGRSVVDDRAEDLVERDERHVDGRRGRSARAGVAAVSVAGVGPLHRDDPRVGAERLGELAATHVESVDPARAALQQDVREAAGRGADVERRRGRPGRSRRRRARPRACGRRG